jgi:hypothetical protein
MFVSYVGVHEASHLSARIDLDSTCHIPVQSLSQSRTEGLVPDKIWGTIA